jgi:alpha-aminoadipic semialdehyde synthase
MQHTIGIRLEDKNDWERRVPLTPDHVKALVKDYSIIVKVQSSPTRTFGDGSYQDAGAEVVSRVHDVPVLFAVKEIPIDELRQGQAYVCFAHVIKGQPENMPTLKKMMDLNCTLIDHEKITDANGRRLVFFGFHAGLAGMIETLWAMGQRYKADHLKTPFEDVLHAYEYPDLASVRQSLVAVGDRIKTEGFPSELGPVVVGFTGYGNVSKGAQDILSALPVTEVSPEEISDLNSSENYNRHTVYKVVFKEIHTVKPIDPDSSFDLKDFFANPSKYESNFTQYLDHLSVLVNCIYWTPENPYVVTLEWLKEAWANDHHKLQVIGDISCDINGGIQSTTHPTNPGEPVFTYVVKTGESKVGIHDGGPLMMTVDNLPCELPKESSTSFGAALLPFVPAIAAADYWVDWDKLDLPDEIKKAIIVYNGKLTKNFSYLQEIVDQL